jgi:hypothetical protein
VSRIYLVTDSAEKPHLVRADNRSQAIRRIAEITMMCHVADQDTLVNLVAAGERVINAGEAQQALPIEGEDE